MKNRKTIFLLITLMIGLLFSTNIFSQELVEIQISPNTLNLQNNGVIVTIHTDIPYSSVVGSTVILNGVEIAWWKSDNSGDFVAKFNMNDVKSLDGIVKDSYNTLTLEGLTASGDTFTGTESIQIISVVPAGGK